MKKEKKKKKVSAADMVFDKMKEFILNGTWPLHEKVPSEGELAEAFGVNRLTVRIALQRLNALGILDTRVGDGTYVCSFDFDQHIHEISDFYMSPGLLEDVTEYRKVIQLECARLAVKRATEEELLELRSCCERFEKELDRYYTLTDPEKARESFIATVDIGLDFHTQLFKMAHNQLLGYSFSIAKGPIRLHMLRNASSRLNDRGSDQVNIWTKTYWAIYKAVEDRDYEECARQLKRLIASED